LEKWEELALLLSLFKRPLAIPLGEEPLMRGLRQDRKLLLGRGSQRHLRPNPLARITDVELVRVRMEFGVTVEQLTEQCPPAALDLRYENQWLSYLHQMLEHLLY
jgi:hypothetical protein